MKLIFMKPHQRGPYFLFVASQKDSLPQFSHRENWHNNGTYLTRLLRRFNEIIQFSILFGKQLFSTNAGCFCPYSFH